MALFLMAGNVQAACMNTLEENIIKELAAKSNISEVNLLFVFNSFCERVSQNTTDIRYYTKIETNEIINSTKSSVNSSTVKILEDYKKDFDDLVQIAQLAESVTKVIQTTSNKDEILTEMNKIADSSQEETYSYLNSQINLSATKQELEQKSFALSGIIEQNRGSQQMMLVYAVIGLIAAIGGVTYYFNKKHGLIEKKESFNMYKTLPNEGMGAIDDLVSNNESALSLDEDRAMDAKTIASEKRRKQKEKEQNNAMAKKLKDKIRKDFKARGLPNPEFED